LNQNIQELSKLKQLASLLCASF